MYNITQIKFDLLEFKKNLKHGDINALSKKSKLTQSTVSRILSGKFKTLNESVKLVCKYANISTISNSRDSDINNVIMELYEVWDGSYEMEQALIEILQAIRRLKPPS